MASSKRQRRRENHFIYDLPYSITRQICCNLDVDKAWEKLASEIGYTIQEVRIFEMAFQHHNGSPCKDVLSDWGSKNATARDLYLILQRIGRRREMQLLESYFNCDSKQNKPHFQSNDETSCNGTETPSMILRALDNTSLPAPPSKGNSRAWSTSSMNGSTSMSDKNVNLNTPENPKDKATKKHAEYKAIPSLTDEQFYPQKKPDYLETMKENSGLSNASASSCDSKSSLSSVKVNQCEMDGPAQGKGDMSEQPLDSTLMETLKNKDGYSSLAKDGECDIDFAVALVGTQNFTTKELNHATNGFSEEYKIGEGAFGEVFKGFLKRTHCAIKRLFLKQEEGVNHQKHLASELKSLIKYRHENIVPLYGYTLEEGDTCLVYQFMQNGSLDDRLRCTHKTPPLTWQQRLEVMKGAACGLQYLHTLDQKPLIHGDIKSSNILLDKHMEAKIADLGLAKHATGGSNQSGKLTHITKKQTCTKQYQTKAYLPPEVIRGNAMSIKGDTFSFGVVMLEVFTGETAYDENREGGQFLKDYVEDFCDSEEKCLELLEKGLGLESKIVIQDYFKLAVQCISQQKKKRPDMVQVHTDLSDLEASFNREFLSKDQAESHGIYNDCLATEPISVISELVELPCSAQQGQKATSSPEEILVEKPLKNEIHPTDTGTTGQHKTEAMKLPICYDTEINPIYSEDSIKMKDFELKCSTKFQTHDQTEDIAKQNCDCESSDETLTLHAAYQTDVYKMDKMNKLEDCLDVSIDSESKQNVFYHHECDNDMSAPLDDLQVAEASIRVVQLKDERSVEYLESSFFIQSAKSDHQPGGNQERLAQEIEAVGKKSGFGAMSLFEKYKEALDMENEEDECNLEDSAVYDEENGFITGVNETDEVCLWQQDVTNQDVSIRELSNEDQDRLMVTPSSGFQHQQGPTIVHFTPSSPTETTEDDCGENDSNLFSSNNSDTDECNFQLIENQKDFPPYLASDRMKDMHGLFEEGIPDRSLFDAKCFQDKYEKNCLTNSVSQSSIDHKTNSTISASECRSEKDVMLHKVNSHWQQQRLEPSEGECFV